jgi:hypothetical protein
VLFDIHGDTYALPLLMFALDALDRRDWRRYALWLMLAVSCKFYVALPVAVLGLLVWRIGRERRVGLLTTVAALMYAVVAFLFIRPLFTTSTTSEAHRGLNYLSFYFGQASDILLTVDQRFLSALIVFGPALFLAWRAWPWLLPAIPLALVALLSTGPGGGFDYRSHHYALVVPFVVAAVIYGAATIREQTQKRPRNWRADLTMTTLIVLIAQLAFVDTVLNPLFYLGLPGRGRDPSAYGVWPRDALISAFLAQHTHPEQRIMASMFFTPQLADRPTLYALRYPQDPGGELIGELLPRVDTVIADALFDYRVPLDDGFVGGIAYERAEIAHLLRDTNFGLGAMHDGLLLFRRDLSADEVLKQQIAIVSASDLPAVDIDFEVARLVGLQVTPLAERRWQLDFVWRRSDLLLPQTPIVAVSRLRCLPQVRIPHLPSYALFQPAEWPRNELVHERFDIELPADIPAGTYQWQLGWYNSGHNEAFLTDERSRLGDEQLLFTIAVPAGDDPAIPARGC